MNHEHSHGSTDGAQGKANKGANKKNCSTKVATIILIVKRFLFPHGQRKKEMRSSIDVSTYRDRSICGTAASAKRY